MAGGLDLKVDRSSDRSVVTAKGEIDLANWREFEKALGAAIARRPSELAVNLKGVGFMSLIALRALMQVIRHCYGQGIVVSLQMSPAVEHVTEISGLGSMSDVTIQLDTGKLKDLDRWLARSGPHQGDLVR